MQTQFCKHSVQPILIECEFDKGGKSIGGLLPKVLPFVGNCFRKQIAQSAEEKPGENSCEQKSFLDFQEILFLLF